MTEGPQNGEEGKRWAGHTDLKMARKVIREGHTDLKMARKVIREGHTDLKMARKVIREGDTRTLRWRGR